MSDPGRLRGPSQRLARDLGYQVREELIPQEVLYMADEIHFHRLAAARADDVYPDEDLFTNVRVY